MKTITIIILSILCTGNLFAQTDKNGNPVFNSVSTNEKHLGDDNLLISNYYTLKTNIENPKSSVFIDQKPSLDQIEKAAVNLPSDFFILTKKSKVIAMIMLQNDPKKQFMILVMSTRQQTTANCNVKGDITQNRANELVKEQYDPKAKIENGVLTFNGKTFNIISDTDIEASILDVINKEKIDKEEPSDMTIPSKKELADYILKETKEGGKLDFFTEIKGKEFDGVQIKPGLFSTQQGVALYKWGRACFEIGVNKVEDAYEIFAAYKGRQLNQRETEYIQMGFTKEFEK